MNCFMKVSPSNVMPATLPHLDDEAKPPPAHERRAVARRRPLSIVVDLW
jgi:hypothetical protein